MISICIKGNQEEAKKALYMRGIYQYEYIGSLLGIVSAFYVDEKFLTSLKNWSIEDELISDLQSEENNNISFGFPIVTLL